ncbi:hypothetical protein [Amycolatopsis benzoatilytica]|uniref:hypothetical protein n=1 Tax=Amycolatopsis benzoatilytica TaxID=346045 RepID=UPI0003AA8E8E|nr:hypothetical protein [Amycolatopsis benzoatilytica]
MSERPSWLGATPDTTERDDLPVRSMRDYVWCFDRKHRRELAGRNTGYHYGLQLSTDSCNRCWARQAPRSKWLVVEHRRPMPVEQAEQPDDRRAKILIVARRPPVRAGVGQLEVRLRGAPAQAARGR